MTKSQMKSYCINKIKRPSYALGVTEPLGLVRGRTEQGRRPAAVIEMLSISYEAKYSPLAEESQKDGRRRRRRRRAGGLRREGTGHWWSRPTLPSPNHVTCFCEFKSSITFELKALRARVNSHTCTLIFFHCMC